MWVYIIVGGSGDSDDYVFWNEEVYLDEQTSINRLYELNTRVEECRLNSEDPFNPVDDFSYFTLERHWVEV